VKKSNKTWSGLLVAYESLLLIRLDPDNSVPLTRRHNRPDHVTSRVSLGKAAEVHKKILCESMRYHPSILDFLPSSPRILHIDKTDSIDRRHPFFLSAPSESSFAGSSIESSFEAKKSLVISRMQLLREIYRRFYLCKKKGNRINIIK